MIPYEERLAHDRRWGFYDACLHFENESSVHKTLRKTARRLDEAHVSYAVAGAMALFFHGYRRFSEDVDILVSQEGLKTIHEAIVGPDYASCSATNTSIRDLEFGVRVDFMVAGDFPGDRRPKPVAFPDPATASLSIERISVLVLPRLVELKLASGISNPRRLRDLADIQEMMKKVQLPPDLVNQLDQYVQAKYTELWTALQQYPEEPLEWTARAP